MAYQFANSWWIEESGEHTITLEFTVSGERKAGRIISLLTLVALFALFVSGQIKGRWVKRH